MKQDGAEIIIFRSKNRHESKQHLVAQFEKSGLDKTGFSLRGCFEILICFIERFAGRYLTKIDRLFVDSHSHNCRLVPICFERGCRTDQDESVRSPLSSLSPTTPTALSSTAATSHKSEIVGDMRGCDGLGMRELEEMWLTESEFGPGCGDEHGSGTEACCTEKQKSGSDGKGRLGKMYMMLKKKGASFSVKRSKNVAGPRAAEATSQAGAACPTVDTWQQDKPEGASPVEQLAAGDPDDADGMVEKATIVVPHQTSAGAAEWSSSRWGGSFRASSSERPTGSFERASSSSGLSKYSEKLGNLSKKAMRTIRHQALTETPYEVFFLIGCLASSFEPCCVFIIIDR